MQCLQLRPQIIVNATDFLPALVFLCLYQKALPALYINCVPNDPFRTSKAGFRIQKLTHPLLTNQADLISTSQKLSCDAVICTYETLTSRRLRQPRL